jgi:hypothetical protein
MILTFGNGPALGIKEFYSAGLVICRKRIQEKQFVATRYKEFKNIMIET